MISSEVQRTLVKSPPELWAEISDPTALGKHLGEFGEIRITRIEPEQRVEWEAGDTSGSVVIKPSGWGTKVKLTVNCPLPEPEPIDAPEAPAQIAAAAEPELDAESESHAVAEAEPEPELDAEPESIVVFEPQQLDADELVEPEHDGRDDYADYDETGVAGQAALDGDPALADDWTLENEADFEDEPELAQAPALELVPELEPRRGFFARLFGRFRAEQPSDLQPLEDEHLQDAPMTDDFPEPPHDLAVSEPTYEALGEIAAWAPLREAIDDRVEPDSVPPAAREAIEPPDPEHDLEAASEQSASEPLGAQVHAPEVEGHADPTQEPHAQEMHTQGAATAAAQAAAELATPTDVPTQAPAPTDLSAQLEAAEEQATEQVAAVLTGVLDRLGAAHHRPFSRA